ncbi:Na+/H+ antiporter subunit E [Fibrobacterales bacterium]|nr:Na+/H+ antiporter subunit E [Fibrobacterales bacterium]
MTYLVLNVFLAVVWMLINSSFRLFDFIVGYAIGMACLWLTQPLTKSNTYFKRFFAFIKLITFFIYDMVVSVVEVVWEILTPTQLSSPDIIKVPLTVSTDLEITLLANLVSLTPGTLSLDVAADRSHLIIHSMFAENPQEVIDSIKNGVEKRILEVSRA